MLYQPIQTLNPIAFRRACGVKRETFLAMVEVLCPHLKRQGKRGGLFQMNRIEEEWHQLKTHEIAGRMFEDEYDLARAIMDGMEARSQRGGYPLERFKFNAG